MAFSLIDVNNELIYNNNNNNGFLFFLLNINMFAIYLRFKFLKWDPLGFILEWTE